MTEEIGDGLSVVSPPDGFRQDHGDVYHLETSGTTPELKPA